MSSENARSSPARRIAGAGLLVAAAGIVIQIAGGADYPTVPPGLLILLAAAALALFAPWRWALIVATVVTVFIGAGGVLAASFREQLGDPGEAVTFAGSVVQVIGLVVGLVGCVLALRAAFRGGGRAATA